jgi:DNA-binding MarR family transcriptional regulator
MTEDNHTIGGRGAVDLAACTCAGPRKAARVVTQIYDAALQPTGLKATQFTLLATLSKRGDLPLTRLAEALVMDRTTLTRILKPLTGKGFVRVGQDEDQRVRRIGLTDVGRNCLDEALPQWRKAQSRLIEELGRERGSGFLDDLTETVNVVQGRCFFAQQGAYAPL